MSNFNLKMPIETSENAEITPKKKEKGKKHKKTEESREVPEEEKGDKGEKRDKSDNAESGTHIHNRTILFIRHGEKPDEDFWGNLSAQGRARGTYIVDVFGVNGALWTGQSPYTQHYNDMETKDSDEQRPLLQKSNTAPGAVNNKKSKKAKDQQLNPSTPVKKANPWTPPVALLPRSLQTPAEQEYLSKLTIDAEKYPVSASNSTSNTSALAPIRYIFASKPNNSGTQHLRMLQTVEPLIAHLNSYMDVITTATDASVNATGQEKRFDYDARLKVDTRFEVDQVKELAQALYDLPATLDPVLVCWEHNSLEDICKLFLSPESGKKLKWPDSDFDSIWVVKDGQLEIRKQGFDADLWETEQSKRRDVDFVLEKGKEQVEGCCSGGCNVM
jgi:hypothetical protein